MVSEAVDTATITRALVAHLKSRSKPPLVFSEIALDGSWGSMGRLDVVAVWIGKAYGSWSITGYEVKRDRRDLHRDLDVNKWRQYLGPCDQFFFAAPSGVARVDEIPDPAGLMTWKNGSWSTAKRALPLAGHGSGPKLATALRLLRRAEEMAHRVPEPTRLERMRAMAEIREERTLAVMLSDRARTAILRAAHADDAVERDKRRLVEQAAAVRSLHDDAAEIPELLNALHSIMAYLMSGVPRGDRWRHEDRAERGERIREVAAMLAARQA